MTQLADELGYPVAGLLGDVAGATRDHHVGPVDVDAGEDLVLAVPVEGDLHLARTNRGLLARAHLSTALATSCSRCLRAIEVPLDLLIDEEVSAQQVLDTLRQVRLKDLESIVLFDVYRGATLPPGKKSLAIRARYRALDRTLTDELVQSLHDKLVQALRKSLGAELR